jgi:DNA-binding beta-propeller fold protein YncE
MDEEKKPDKVTVWNSRGDFLHEWGKSGAGAGEFNFPGGLVVGRNERLYVADQTNHRIQVFDTTGRYITEWGKYGTKTGEFGGNTSAVSRVGGPQFVAADSSGHIYTTEGSMGRVQKFTAEGEFLLAWGDNNTTEGSFGGGWQIDSEEGLQGPIGILADRYDTIWVSAAGGRVQQFSHNGEYLRGIGEGKGTGPDQFLVPHGLTMDSRDNLYVVDSFNHRIQKFHIPRYPL